VKFALAAAVAVGLVTSGASFRWAPASAEAQAPSPRPAGKPLSELEALRQENELLKVNLRVLLEKVKRQEAELAALGGAGKPGSSGAVELRFDERKPGGPYRPSRQERPVPKGGIAPSRSYQRPGTAQNDPLADPSMGGAERGPSSALIEFALDPEKMAPPVEAKAKAKDELEKAIQALRRQLKALEGQ
jgi:hypothetical protein